MRFVQKTTSRLSYLPFALQPSFTHTPQPTHLHPTFIPPTYVPPPPRLPILSPGKSSSHQNNPPTLFPCSLPACTPVPLCASAPTVPHLPANTFFRRRRQQMAFGPSNITSGGFQHTLSPEEAETLPPFLVSFAALSLTPPRDAFRPFFSFCSFYIGIRTGCRNRCVFF